MKIVIFAKNERIHDWYIGNVEDPNDLSFMVTNCNYPLIRYSIAEIRRMENDLQEQKLIEWDFDSVKEKLRDLIGDVNGLQRRMSNNEE